MSVQCSSSWKKGQECLNLIDIINYMKKIEKCYILQKVDMANNSYRSPKQYEPEIYPGTRYETIETVLILETETI